MEFRTRRASLDAAEVEGQWDDAESLASAFQQQAGLAALGADNSLAQRSKSLPYDVHGDGQHHVSMLPPLEAAGVYGENEMNPADRHMQHGRATPGVGSSGVNGVGDERDFARKISLLSREVREAGSHDGNARNNNSRNYAYCSSNDSDGNNLGLGRSSFDRLLLDLDSMELASSTAAARRKSEGDTMFLPMLSTARKTARAAGYLSRDGFSSFSNQMERKGGVGGGMDWLGGSEHGGASAAEFLSTHEPPGMERMRSTTTGFIIDSKPVTSSDRVGRFRAGPSEGAHASKLVDGGESLKGVPILSQPRSIVDADFHDTYGAHKWAPPSESADWRKGGNKTPRGEKGEHRIVSKSPTLSPIRSPIGSPMMSPNRNFMTTNLSSHVSPHYLERRSLRLAQMRREEDAAEQDGSWFGNGRGYIAEAKRVLDEAMHMLDGDDERNGDDPGSRGNSGEANFSAKLPNANPHDAVSMSPSGALEPLMRHLKAATGDDAKCRAALRTLTLLETNLPNRGIISDLHGRRILMDVVLKCSPDAIDVKENAIQLMWDLDHQAGRSASSVFTENDLHALVIVLCQTTSCQVASHTLHFLRAAIDQPPQSRPRMTEDGLRSLAAKLTSETCSHKHPIPDSAQYCLGETLAQILSELAVIDEPYATACMGEILDSLMPCRDELQCQILLTVLSSLAVKRRLVDILVAIDGVAKIHRFTNATKNSRLHARGFSLWKVVSSNVPGGVNKPARS